MRDLAKSEVHYHCLLSQMYAQGSKDKEIIKTLVTNCFNVGMKASLRLAAKELDDDELIVIFKNIPKTKYKGLIFELAKNKRQDLILKLLSLMSHKERRTYILYTHEDNLKEVLSDEMIESFSFSEWKLFAKNHPHYAFQCMKSLIKQEGDNYNLRVSLLGILETYYENIDYSSYGLSLIEESIDVIPQQFLLIPKYISLFPEQTIQLVLKNPQIKNLNISLRTYQKISTDLFREMLKHPNTFDILSDFKDLDKEFRNIFYEDNNQFLRSSNGIMNISYLNYLPKEIRIKEARLALKSDELKSQLLMLIPYIAYLPYDEAIEALRPFMNQPDGNKRGFAYASYIKIGRYHEDKLDEILDFCISKKNEQDPVRSLMLQELVQLPQINRWSDDHLKKIEMIIMATFDNSDSSHTTISYCNNWISSLLTHYTDFAVEVLSKLIKKTGFFFSGIQKHPLTSEVMISIDNGLKSIVKNWVRRDDVYNMFQLVRFYQNDIIRTYKYFDKEGYTQSLNMIDSLITLTSSKNGSTAQQALNLLKELKLNNILFDLIPNLLKKDKSWIKTQVVQDHISQKRQNLLDEFLFAQLYTGKFKSNVAFEVIYFQDSFYKWNESQQLQYEHTLSSILTKEEVHLWESYKIISCLSKLPSGNLKLLKNLAELYHANLAERDRALEALSRVDGNRGATVIIESLFDARSKTSIYVLNNVLKGMSDRDGLDVLFNVPLKSITVTKEVIRLIGSYQNEEAYQFLMNFRNVENLHQDVEIALLRSLWNYLEKEEVWDYFNDVSKYDNTAIVFSTIYIPQEGLNTQGKKNLTKHLTHLLNHPAVFIVNQVLHRLVNQPTGIEDDDLYINVSHHLESEIIDRRYQAARVLMSNFVKNQSDRVANTFSTLSDPKYINTVIKAYDNLNNSNTRMSAYLLVRELMENRKLSAISINLAFQNLTIPEIKEIIKLLEKENLMNPGIVSSSLSALNVWVKNNGQLQHNDFELYLSEHSSETIQVIGFELLMVLVDTFGYNKDYLTRLESYKIKDSIWIKEKAELIEVPQYDY